MKATKKDKETLKSISKYFKKHGYMPSYREIGEDLGLSSSSSVYTRIHRLFELDYLETDYDIDFEPVPPRAYRINERINV